MGAARRRGRRGRDPPYFDRPRRNARRVRSRADRAGRRCRPRPRDRVRRQRKRERCRGAVHDDRKRRRAGRLDLSFRRGRRLRSQTRTRRPWRPRASERRGGVIDSMSFDERGLVPAIVQDAGTGAVLMLAYMDREALEATLRTREVHFHSRSRGRLWKKGETSGNVMHLVSLVPDCDADALLVKVHPAGPACHTGDATCFGPVNDRDLGRFLSELAAVLRQRRRDLPEGSYSAELFKGGAEVIAAKLVEEANETAAALRTEGRERALSELTDLLYVMLVAATHLELTADEVRASLEQKRREAPARRAQREAR